MLLLANTCTIRRNQAIGTNGRQQLQDLATGVACLALPMHHQAAIENKFSLGRAYDIYFDIAQDLRVDDTVVIGSDSYVVKAVQNFTMPIVGHLRALCEQEVQ